MGSTNAKARLLTFLLVFAIIGIGDIYRTWYSYVQQEMEHVIGIVESAAAFLPEDTIAGLLSEHGTDGSGTHGVIWDCLTALKQRNPNILRAFMLTDEGDAFKFLVDTSEDTNQSQIPIQESKSLLGQYVSPFLDAKPRLVGSFRIGGSTKVSALAPIKEASSGDVVAVLGIDYSTKNWDVELISHIIHVLVALISILLLLVAVYDNRVKSRFLRLMGERLEESEELFGKVFAQAPVGIAILEEGERISVVNPTFERIYERKQEELSSMEWTDLTHPDDLRENREKIMELKRDKSGSYSVDKRIVRPGGSYRWISKMVSGLDLNNGNPKSKLCIIQDIDEQKRTHEALARSEQEKAALLSHLPGMVYRCSYDDKWTILDVSAGCYDITGYSPDQIMVDKALSYKDLIAKEYFPAISQEWKRSLDECVPFRYEYEIMTACGGRKWVMEIGRGISASDGMVAALEGIMVDISERKEKDARIQYLNDHDLTTGIYNRMYFEMAKHRLDEEGTVPLSMMIGDINGIRIINDAFGHDEGDRMIVAASKILQSCLRDGDILARTGGNEFSILLPNTSDEETYEIMKSIKGAFNEHNSDIPDRAKHITLSFGYGTKRLGHENLDLAKKEAEENMYKRKLLARNSYHSAILSSIMATLHEKSQETKEHAERIAKHCLMIGRKVRLPQKSRDELQLLSMLHDVGKVGIDDRILSKRSRLTAEEWVVMKKHPEIGFRIASSSPELKSIARYILSHHERWDGTGYPQGLKGEEIPLLSRILAVSDAYDAMTEKRLYRKPISKDAAVKEIVDNAGTQFDPEIVRIFVEEVLPEESGGIMTE